MTGVDAARAISRVAGLHAEGQALAIDYRQGTAEALADAGAQFDIVLALEIVEHVADVDLFLSSCGRLVKPGGLLFLSTLNRTAKAWALAIAGAEYVLGWLPRGTHDWRKFLKPSEAVNGLRSGGIEAQEIVAWSTARSAAPGRSTGAISTSITCCMAAKALLKRRSSQRLSRGNPWRVRAELDAFVGQRLGLFLGVSP